MLSYKCSTRALLTTGGICSMNFINSFYPMFSDNYTWKSAFPCGLGKSPSGNLARPTFPSLLREWVYSVHSFMGHTCQYMGQYIDFRYPLSSWSVNFSLENFRESGSQLISIGEKCYYWSDLIKLTDEVWFRRTDTGRLGDPKGSEASTDLVSPFLARVAVFFWELLYIKPQIEQVKSNI